jgi:septal ring-binding cell division protein DamX
MQRWRAAGRKGHYTLQLVGVGKRQSLEAFLARFPAGGDRVIHRSRRDGRDWLELFNGIYPTRQSAVAAVGSLPPELAAQGPWVRRIPTGGQLEPPSTF